MIFAAPVEPDADEAREWLVRELSKPPYREAEPNLFDQLASRVLEWLEGLLDGVGGAPPELLLVVVVLVVAGLVVAAYFIFGAPRLARRSAAAGALFGDDDGRDAATIRREAHRAATAGDFALAVEEMFRAIARGLSERAVLSSSPGTTATGFATGAAEFFPDQRSELAASALAFDDVRYLGRTGSEEAWLEVERLDVALQAASPRFDAAVTV